MDYDLPTDGSFRLDCHVYMFICFVCFLLFVMSGGIAVSCEQQVAVATSLAIAYEPHEPH